MSARAAVALVCILSAATRWLAWGNSSGSPSSRARRLFLEPRVLALSLEGAAARQLYKLSLSATLGAVHSLRYYVI